MMDPSERALFAASVGALVATGDVDVGLASVGWGDALAEDPRVAVGVLFEAQGRAGATSAALDLVLASALGAPAVDGDPATAVVLPALGATAAPGRVDGDLVVVHGLATTAVDRSGTVLVATDDGRIVAAATDELDCRRVHGLDPRLGLVEVRGSVAVGEAAATRGAWPEAVAAGQRAVAHELVGASRAMLELARGHALDRVQFGVPIATFQAVRHRLADSLVAIESAAAAVEAAWDEPGPVSASVAKAVAGRGARVVAKHCQQVLAGIGFTAEHAFHPLLRRSRLLDGLLGDARSLTRELGESLLQARRLPPILPL